MLKCDSISGFVKIIVLSTFLLLIHVIIFSQPFLLKGVVKDKITLNPIKEVNIKIYGTTKGTSTDRTGTFSLRLYTLPATLAITCLGYEVSYYDITVIPEHPVELLLTPKSYTLPEVDVSAEKFTFLFKDRNYSVLDYEIMGDNILLLIFRYQLRRSELVLLSREGDTLTISKLPEVPPSMLFRDFLSNVHYFSRAGNAYQCFFNEKNSRLDFISKTTVDSLEALVSPYLFKMSDRLYFRESLPDGFGMSVGYNANGLVKKYVTVQMLSTY